MSLALVTGEEPSLFDRIGAILRGHDLDASPLNYGFCHRYLAGDDPEFTAAVDHAIAAPEGLTERAVVAITAADGADVSGVTGVTAEALQAMADEAQSFLHRVTGIVDASGRDVEAYNDALGAKAAAIVGSHGTAGTADALIEGLVALTRTMIERSRDAGAHLRRTGEEIEALRIKLIEARHCADSDALTGLPNRRALDQRMREAGARAQAAGTPLAVAICDIDHFKRVNDVHGHAVGDEVIKMMAATLGTIGHAFVSRYGGEEFVVVFDQVDAAAAAGMIDRVRRDIAGRDIKVTSTGRRLGHISFSAGVADFDPARGGSDMLKRADDALYRAKAEGRDRVILAGSAADAAAV